MITVSAIKCPKCGDIIYSRCRHDMRWCYCRNCAIDGGFSEYTKITAVKDLDKINTFKLDVNATEQKLYDDWNNNTNEYGLIKQGVLYEQK